VAASKIIAQYEQQQRAGGEEDEDGKQIEADYEAGELVLYKAKVLQDAGDVDGALAYLAKNDGYVTDVRGLNHTRGELLLSAGKLKEAEALYRQLLAQNPENESYYGQIEKTLGYSDSTPQDERLTLYTQTLETFPKCHGAKRLPLFFATGDLFEKLLDEYLRPNIRKGMSPVFRNIRRVYNDPAKVAIIEKTANAYVAAMKSCGKLADDEESQPENPTTLVWALYFAAQHYDQLRQLPKALELINEAIAHTPTVLELYMVKAKIYKHAGDAKEAAHWLNFARDLDTADRYINSKCVKYMLRANELKKAEETISPFTRETGTPIETLQEMQCVWFSTEQARAFIRTGEIAKALQVLHVIDGHFETMIEDQFDFHTYCLRKLTLRAYTALLSMTDVIRGHKFYQKVALLAAECYIGLHDVPYGSKEREEADAKLAGMTAAERKKMLSKERKKAKQAAMKAAKAGGAKAKAKASDDGEEKKTPTDAAAEGERLAKTDKPLDMALKFLAPLIKQVDDSVEVQRVAFEVYARKQKILLMLRAVKKAKAIAPGGAVVHRMLIRFLKALETFTVDPKVKQVVEAELEALVGSNRDPAAINAAFLAANGGSLPHVAAAAEMSVVLDSAAQASAVKALLAVNLDTLTGVELEGCMAVGRCIDGTFKDAAAFAQWKELCLKRFPLAKW